MSVYSLVALIRTGFAVATCPCAEKCLPRYRRYSRRYANLQYMRKNLRKSKNLRHIFKVSEIILRIEYPSYNSDSKILIRYIVHIEKCVLIHTAILRFSAARAMPMYSLRSNYFIYAILCHYCRVIIFGLFAYYSYIHRMPKSKVKEQWAAILWENNEKNKKARLCDVVDLICIPKKYRTEGCIASLKWVDTSTGKTSYHKAEVVKISSK